ncbi:MAG: SMI1/KNR4 family protein [Bacteroidia bacterium]|nr:SMI1/KNR4 family protein [Bacteroidia bacterium]MDW8159429.1 SMI1/KNR4 family protein [Bacteroidia bacterium]
MFITTVMTFGKWAKSLFTWLEHIKKGAIAAIPQNKKEEPQNNLEAFEKLLSHKLPASYINFLKQKSVFPTLEYACDVYSSAPFPQKLYSFVIYTFFNIRKSPKYNLYYNWVYYKNLLKNKYLPIACDAFGNIMAMDLDNYHIYFFQFDSQNPKKEANVYFVAESFEEFLNLIYRKRSFI